MTFSVDQLFDTIVTCDTADVSTPVMLLTTTKYGPLFVVWEFRSTSVELVAPGTATPLKNH